MLPLRHDYSPHWICVAQSHSLQVLDVQLPWHRLMKTAPAKYSSHHFPLLGTHSHAEPHLLTMRHCADDVRLRKWAIHRYWRGGHCRWRATLNWSAARPSPHRLPPEMWWQRWIRWRCFRCWRLPRNQSRDCSWPGRSCWGLLDLPMGWRHCFVRCLLRRRGCHPMLR